MPTAVDVYNQIKIFFSNPHLPILEQLCRGKPEKIIQKLLFAYLQGSFGLSRVKAEVKYTCHIPLLTGNKSYTVIDFIVLDENLRDIICCIELKHYSANQGPLQRLLNGIARSGKQQRFHLDEDFEKCRPCVSLIQIGVFSAIEDITSTVPAAAFSGYPFIKSYVLKRNETYALPKSTYWADAQKEFKSWKSLSRYTTPKLPATINDLIHGTTQTFAVSPTVQVTGRVNYFIGLTTQFPNEYPCSEAGATIDDRADM